MEPKTQIEQPKTESGQENTVMPNLQANEDDGDEKRKKYRSIREQICFYFSDSNLNYDRYMRKLVGLQRPPTVATSAAATGNPIPEETNEQQQDLAEQNGTKPVPLELFLKFNKITAITKTLDDLVAAFRDDSAILERNQLEFVDVADRPMIRRIRPFDARQSDATYRTLYLEGFNPEKSDDIIETFRRCFAATGYEVLSVRMPKLNNNSGISAGFVFVEFGNEPAANQCCRLLERLTEEINNPDGKPDPIPPPPADQKALKETLITLKHPDYKLRVLSKYQWNHYKNRYLRFQKKFRPGIWRRDMENLANSFILKPLPPPQLPVAISGDESKQPVRQFQQRPKRSHPDDECDESVSGKSNETENSTSGGAGHIIRIDLVVPASAPINYSILRQTFRKLVQSGHEIGGGSRMPNLNDIAYIDTAQLNMVFQEDGTTRQTVFVRTNTADGAAKLAADGDDSENPTFVPYVKRNFPKEMGTIDRVKQLDEKELGEYWRSVNQSKRVKRSKNC